MEDQLMNNNSTNTNKSQPKPPPVPATASARVKINAEAFQAEFETLIAEPVQIDEIEDDGFQNLFKIQTANLWIDEAKLRPAPKMLFGEFWYEGEVCILFADTNVGKSILAVQIADNIAKGEAYGLLCSETKAQKVIYFDFELSDKQFEGRYSEKANDYFTNHYSFSENFYRAEINPDNFLPDRYETFEEYLNDSIKFAVANTGAKVLVIDNLTYLRNETERAKDALPLMKHLKALKNKFDLSILVLAHTPKRDMSKPITRNDLQGSKMLINFCDSSFAIGESNKDKSLRYLKQIKVRNSEFKFDSENVVLCEISKPTNFLSFDFSDFGQEKDHLKDYSTNDKDERIIEARTLAAEGKTQAEIARILGVTRMSIGRYLKASGDQK
jgi:archaellum biogenesis ATPase FlaH